MYTNSLRFTTFSKFHINVYDKQIYLKKYVFFSTHKHAHYFFTARFHENIVQLAHTLLAVLTQNESFSLFPLLIKERKRNENNSNNNKCGVLGCKPPISGNVQRMQKFHETFNKDPFHGHCDPMSNYQQACVQKSHRLRLHLPLATICRIAVTVHCAHLYSSLDIPLHL